MGSILLTTTTGSREVPLAGATVLGRHPGCTWSLDDPDVPTFWVELRWTPAGWVWRELGGEARGPRRPCAAIGPGWYRVAARQRIEGPTVRVELVDARAPARFAVDLERGEVLVGDSLEALVVEVAGRPLPADWERRGPDVPPLTDGQPFEVAGRLYRFHEASPPTATSSRQLDLGRHTCRIELRGEDHGPELCVWDGPVECRLQGAPVWALVPYLEARLTDLPAGGWLAQDEAWSRWRELLPGTESEPERIGQDRSRVCRQLRTRGVAAAHDLFERRWMDGHWEVRIKPDPARLGLELGAGRCRLVEG